MIGSIWVGAKDRKQALTVARGVLSELWIAGTLQTNERFLSELLAHPWVKEGIFHAGFVDEEFIPSPAPPAELIPLFAAICSEALGPVKLNEGDREGWFIAGRIPAPAPKTGLIPWTEPPRRWELPAGTAISGTIQHPDGRKLRAAAFPLVPGRWQARIGLWNVTVRRVHKQAGATPQPRILALVPGKVDSILFRADAVAPAHEPILILESLRMLIPHALPAAVRIKKWKVKAGDDVELGQELAEFEMIPAAPAN
jgi:acetyl/propionyl-CoA carboxylase alpha subunit